MTTIICLMEKGYLTIDIEIGTIKIIVLNEFPLGSGNHHDRTLFGLNEFPLGSGNHHDRTLFGLKAMQRISISISIFKYNTIL